MAAERITPSFEQLLEAWAARRRPNWPLTMAETMRDPLLAAIVRSEALRRIVARRQAAAHPLQPGQPAPPTVAPAHTAPARTTRPTTAPAPARPAVDLKRRAAGDNDDD